MLFGFGKNKKTDDVAGQAQPEEQLIDPAQFAVHTMNDDIMGDGTVAPPIGIAGAAPQQANATTTAPQATTPSPFLDVNTGNTAPTPTIEPVVATPTETTQQTDHMGSINFDETATKQAAPTFDSAPFGAQEPQTPPTFAAPTDEAPSRNSLEIEEKQEPISFLDVPEALTGSDTLQFEDQKTQVSAEELKPAPVASTKDLQPRKTFAPVRILLVALSVFFTVLIIGGAAYYFIFWQSAEDSAVLADTDLEVPQVEQLGANGDGANDGNQNLLETPDVPDPVTALSLEFPNHFEINPTVPTVADDIRSEMNRVSRAISATESGRAYAFRVANSSNTAVVTRDFLLSAGVNLPETLLTSLDDSFLLYAYDDAMAQDVRFGIVIDLVSPLTAEALLAVEADLANSLTMLYNGALVDNPTQAFSDSTYGAAPIRYANINAANTLSVDYALLGTEKLVIGTSKDSIRAIIDEVESTF